MNEKREDELLAITARYVAEVRAAQQPRLSDYVTRYPQYANEIADFVAYYHAVEERVSTQSATSLPSLSATSRSVLARVQRQSLPAQRELSTLLCTARGQRLPLAQLAQQLHISEDILIVLEERRVAAATLPAELYAALERILGYPVASVRSYLSRSSTPKRSLYTGLAANQVAETQASYQGTSETMGAPSLFSFRQALASSKQITDDQKLYWLLLLDQEGL